MAESPQPRRLARHASGAASCRDRACSSPGRPGSRRASPTCRCTGTTTASRKAERQYMRTLPCRRFAATSSIGTTACWRRAPTWRPSTPSRQTSTMRRRPRKALCSALDDCTPDVRAMLTERLGKSRPFQYVKRHVTPDEAEAVRALKLDGIGFMTESHRFYPNRDLLGPTLGYVGYDNKGLGGLEQQYDSHDPRRRRQGGGRHRRQEARLRPHRAAAVCRRVARVDDRQRAAARRRARAGGRDRGPIAPKVASPS